MSRRVSVATQNLFPTSHCPPVCPFTLAMPVTRRSARLDHSASTTPSTTVSNLFSAGTSSRSTPDTSVIDEDDTVLPQVEKKTKKVATKKRVREDVSEEEQPVTRRGAKRRMVQQAAYVEITTKKIPKVTPFLQVCYCCH